MRERIACLLIAAVFLPPLDSGSRHGGAPGVCTDEAVVPFYEVAGVTTEEVLAIEVRIAGGDTLIYGTTPSSESFVGDNGEVCGFTARMCEWMSALLGIAVKPVMYSWGDLINGLERGEIDFTGELTATQERLEKYFMTDAIAKRAVKCFRIEGAAALNEIARNRPPRCAFLSGATTWRAVAASFPGSRMEPVFVDNTLHVYDMLKSGSIDAFFNEAPGEYVFDAYSDVVAHSFVPLIYEPVSLATRSEALAPFISVAQKALSNGGRAQVAKMYSCGHNDYQKHKMAARLTDVERAYIRDNPVARFAAEYDNYPVSFYNAHESSWQGIAFDVMGEVSRLTGLKFERVNARKAEWPELLKLLESGEAAMVTELVRTEERERGGKFLWPKRPFLVDSYALVSKAEYPNMNLNEILSARVALMKQASYTECFRRWFPDHANSVEYDNYELAVEALVRGEADLMMSSRKELVALINYNERSGYKANVIFDQALESTFGFGVKDSVLAGIIDKALGVIDVGAISDNWMYKTYDYRVKVAEAQRPWLLGASLLTLAVLAIILAMFYKGRTKRKQLVKLVAEKTSTLTAIFNATPDLILCKDLKSRITECNRAVENYFDTEKPGIIGKSDADAFGMPPELVKQYVATDRQIFKSKQAVTVEESIPASGGQMQLFETIKSPLIEDGRVTGLVAMSRDITSRKAAEEEAKSASCAKTSFVANMSHEMRTPMNVIVGLTDLMLEDDGTPCYLKETLKKVSTAGGTLMGLINNVLDISKIESGKLELMPVQYETASLINDIVTLNMIRIEDKPITFTLDVEEDVPSMMVGDDLRVKQVLNNLLSNAFKYTDTGSVNLSVSAEVDCGDVWVTFRISDTGKGIREEEIERLFTDYNQVNALANREIEGAGLGLSITKKIVEQMDGTITVESVYGEGTVFCVTIRQTFATDKPIGKETADNLRSFRYADKKKRPHEKLSRPNLSYAKVLVVDDFPTNLDVAAGMLRKYKMQVDCVTSGKEAVARMAAAETQYDAIFMDHMMPEMDGMEATEAIRALGTQYAEEVPIIALTANAVAGNEKIFLERGFNAFLSKPINVTVLDAVVQRWVRDRSKDAAMQ